LVPFGSTLLTILSEVEGVAKKLRLVCKTDKNRAKYRLWWLVFFSHHHRTKAEQKEHKGFLIALWLSAVQPVRRK
jgi:hypothetical protein